MKSQARYTLPLVIGLALLLGAASALSGQDRGSREFPASPGQTLSIYLKTGGSVRISGWDRPLISVSFDESRQGRGGIDVQFIETGQGLEIRSERTRGDRRQWSNPRFDVRVPRQFDVEFDSMGGGLHLKDVEGNFTGKTMGGSLRLENVSGQAGLTTMGGEIQLTDSDLDGFLKTMGGKVTFRDVLGDVEGSSMGGNVSYQNVRRRSGEFASPRGEPVEGTSADTVQISTMGGSIEIDEAPRGANVHTMGGTIRIANASQFVKAKTMGGDIEIEDSEGWIQATTMGGDIDVSLLPGSRGDIHLVSMSGDIELRVPAGFSMDLDLQIAYTRNSSKSYRIVSDFDLSQGESGSWDYGKGTPRKYIYGSGSLAGGHNRIRIETINGNIYLRKK